MKKFAMILAMVCVLGAGTAMGDIVNVCPGNIGSDSITRNGNGSWPTSYAWLAPDGYDFAANRHSYDLTGDGPLALQGFVDISQTTATESDFYSLFVVRDNQNREVKTVFTSGSHGGWYGLDPRSSDRIRMENNIGLNQPEMWYLHDGGELDGGRGYAYPSDRSYYFQLIADAQAQTFTLQVFGMGARVTSTDPWLCTYDYDTWYEIGTINVGNNFDFSAVEFYSGLMASPSATSSEYGTVSWDCMNIGSPISTQDIPSVPVPGSLLLCGIGLAFIGVVRRFRKK